MSQPIKGQSGHLRLQIGQKNTKLVEDVKTCFQSNFVEWLQRRCRKFLSKPDAKIAIFVLPISPITKPW